MNETRRLLYYKTTKYAQCSRIREANCNLPGQVSDVSHLHDARPTSYKTSSNNHRCSHGFIEDQPLEWTQLDYHSEVWRWRQTSSVQPFHFQLGEIPATFPEFVLQWGFGLYKLHLYNLKVSFINLFS